MAQHEMMIPERPDFLPAPAGASVAGEFLGGVSGGASFPTLSVRGKVFRLRRSGEEASLKTSTLGVILAGARSSMSRRYNDSPYQAGKVEAPACASRDGITPDAGVRSPQAAKCAECPRNVWEDKRKDCNDFKRVAVFIPEKKLLSPILLDIAATSMKKKQGETGPELHFREYVQALARHGFEPHQVVTTIGFSEDAEYPRMVFSFERVVTRGEWSAVCEFRDGEEYEAALGFVEATGTAVIPIVPAKDEEEAPAPKAKPKAKPEEDEEEAEAEPVRKPRPQTVVDSTPDDDEDPELDAVMALLK